IAHETKAMPPSAIDATQRGALVKLEHRHECFLRDLDRTHPLHPSLSFFLLLEQLALAGDVAPVALGQDILAHRRYRLARDHLTADGRLDRHFVQLAGNDRLERLAQLPTLD